MKEWRDCIGYEGHYQVSDEGDVRTLNYMGCNKIKEIKSHHNQFGYLLVTFIEDGKYHTKLVHRLVAEAFVPNPENLPCINHRNEIKDDNRPENLEWCTQAYNNTYGTRIQRQAESLRGQKRTEEQCKRISDAKKSMNIHHTEEWKKNHSSRMTGTGNPIYGLRRKRVYNEDGSYKYIIVN